MTNDAIKTIKKGSVNIAIRASLKCLQIRPYSAQFDS
jgi:hypothetical protein